MTKYQLKEDVAIPVALERNSLLIPTELAKLIGLHEALVLQQMHYWMCKGAGKIVDGIRWIWNSVADWLEQIPLTSWKLRRAFERLEHEFRLIKRSRLDKRKWNQTTYYTIDYERLKALQLSICGIPQIELWDTTNRFVTDHKSYKEAETTTETTSKTTARTAAAILNFEEESRPRPLASLKEETELIGVELEVTGLDESSAAMRPDVENEKLDLVDSALIALNPQLKRELMNYTLEQVSSAVDHYRAAKREKGERSNPAGWLIECLRGQWWVGTTTDRQDTKYQIAKSWIDWAIKQGLISSSTNDPRITLDSGENLYVAGRVNDYSFQPWEEVASLYPLPVI